MLKMIRIVKTYVRRNKSTGRISTVRCHVRRYRKKWQVSMMNMNTKMAWVLDVTDFVLANDVSFWIQADSIGELKNLIKEEFLRVILNKLLDDDYETYEDAWRAATTLGITYNGQFFSIGAALGKIENANSISEMNRIYYELKANLHTHGKDINICCFDSPYDAIPLLESHIEEQVYASLYELDEKFDNDQNCQKN